MIRYWCPRCDQGWVVPAVVRRFGVGLLVCRECEAVWRPFAEPEAADFGDLGELLEGLGLHPCWDELDVAEEL